MARSLRAVIALLALFIATVGLAAPASAHTWDVKATCDTLTVDLKNYNNNGGGKNSVEIKINNEVELDLDDFGTDLSETFAFDDPTKTNTWSVKVKAHDGDEWSFHKKGTEKPCQTPPVTPGEPKITDECAEGGIAVEIPTTEGVEYTVGDEVVTGTYVYLVDEGESYDFTVKAESTDGKPLEGKTEWQFTGTRECEEPVTPVTPAKPTASIDCAEGGLALTIPETEGVEYLIDEEVVEAGDYLFELAEGEDYDITVTARALGGYVIEDGAKTEFTFSGKRECEPTPEPTETHTPAPTPSEPPAAAPVKPVDTAPASATLPRTGSQIGTLAGIAAVVLALGAGLVLVARRRSA